MIHIIACIYFADSGKGFLEKAINCNRYTIYVTNLKDNDVLWILFQTYSRCANLYKLRLQDRNMTGTGGHDSIEYMSNKQIYILRINVVNIKSDFV